VQQIRKEAGDGPAAAAATGERHRRYKAQFGSGFSIFLIRENCASRQSSWRGLHRVVNHPIFHSELGGRPHFQQIKKLEAQCSCTSAQDDRKACAAWWDQKTMIHHALKLPPTFWPCLPDPNGPVSPGAKALYAALDAALTGM
jgi:hypothetical protein